MARPKTRVKRIILGMFAIMQLSILMSGTGVRAADSNSDNIDDDLVVSFAASGVQNFPDSDAGETESISEINFSTSGNTFNYSTTNLTNGSTIQAKRLFGANANSYQNIGSGSGSISLGNAVVWGGAGGTGQYAIPPQSGSTGGWVLNFTSTQRYIGLWWSAGNTDNQLQLLDANGNALLSPVFSTASITSALLNNASCPASAPTAAQIQNNSGLAYCGNPNNYPYVNEPFAFIHLRLDSGFRGVRFYGRGFEFDNVTFSETVPSTGATEETVGTVAPDGPLPDVLLADPRATTIDLPSSTLSGSNNIGICFEQVANSAGDALSGNATISFSRNTSITGVTETTTTNRWRYTGSRAAITDQIPELRINGVSSNPVVTDNSKWMRIRMTHDTAATNCVSTNPANIVQIVEIRPLTITSSNTRSIGID